MQTKLKKGTRVNWLGKEMYLGHIAETNVNSAGKITKILLKKEAEYDLDQLTFVSVEGPEERLSVTLYEAQQLIKNNAFKVMEGRHAG